MKWAAGLKLDYLSKDEYWKIENPQLRKYNLEWNEQLADNLEKKNTKFGDRNDPSIFDWTLFYYFQRPNAKNFKKQAQPLQIISVRSNNCVYSLK
jgi:hypothetical protein